MKLQNQKIVFAGDSITDMNRGRNPRDLNHIYGHSYVFLLAAKLLSDPQTSALTLVNRGVSGNNSTDLLVRWQTDVLDESPDVVSLLIGINDVWQEKPDLDRYAENLEKMYAITAQSLPQTAWIVCEPFAFPSLMQPSDARKYSQFVPQVRLLARQFAERHDALFVPLQATFDEAAAQMPSSHWIWDGVHPTAAGHWLLASQWLRCVTKGES